MKRTVLLIAAAMLMTSCVSLGKYEKLESASLRLQKELATSKSELSQMKNENAELIRQNQTLNSSLDEMTKVKQSGDSEIERMKRELEEAQRRFDTMMENNEQRLNGKNRDLMKTQDKLVARTQELQEKEDAFKIKEAEMKKKQEELERAEQEAKAALEAKERELEQIRLSVTNALVGFTDKGMQVETKDGKVYVSMESKLMFPSASWTVSTEGKEAIKGLAHVLEENPDLNIMVEGHTDTDPYNGQSGVKDNWDLSVMRATAIVKLILEYGKTIDPTRIVAAGHGQFMPKVDNDTRENKAQNRRTEIILTPKLSEILQMIGE